MKQNFDIIYNSYWQRVFRLCMAYCNDSDIAQDLAQETFIKVWQNLKQFQNKSGIKTWIYRIATNTCLRYLEKERKMPKIALDNTLAQDTKHNNQDEIALLYQFIAELPKLERIIISLELEDVAQRDIAEIVGLEEGNIRVKIYRIKNKLTKKFNQYGNTKSIK